MIRKNLLVLAAIAVVLIVLAMLLLGRVHYVDNKPSIAVAESYFTELEKGKVDSAFVSYSGKFREENDKTWRDLLTGLQLRFGAVTAFKLTESKIVPVSEVGCTLLRYQVSRGSLSTEEQMMLCPDKASTSTIIGHEVIRLDTHQRISAGQTVQEVGVHVP
jgi:hypothetical protein